MRIEISSKILEDILNSRTLTKILYKVLYGFDKARMLDPNVEGIQISMEDLRKALGYKNKSTVSRGLKELSTLGIFDLITGRKGTTIRFFREDVIRIPYEE